MAFFDQFTTAWINRQYRMTFRAVLSGLLASGQPHDRVIEVAHALTMQALQQIKNQEV